MLPLSGGLRVTVTAEAAPGESEATYDLVGRDSVFTRVTDFAYAGRDSVLTLLSVNGAEVALPSALCERRRPPAYGPAEDVPVEVRGAGGATRQVTGFGIPGVWDHAERLVACELLTPPGNWSSYPPHKHDPTEPCEVVNEEIYYYRIAGPDQVTPSSQGFGLHRTYTDRRARQGRARADRPRRRGARRRRRAGAARLPRTVRGRAGLSDVLPQRAGRTEAPTGRWRSATTRTTGGCAARGTASSSTHGCR